MNKRSFGEVIPGLSIRSDELMRRLENKSYQVSQEGKVYSDDPELVATLRMDRAELFRSHLKDTERIRGLKEQAKAEDKALRNANAKAREEQIFAKAKAEAIAELSKAKGNG